MKNVYFKFFIMNDIHTKILSTQKSMVKSIRLDQLVAPDDNRGY